MATNEMGVSADEVLPVVAEANRDRCRTPVQWENAPNAGFSPPDVTTWLPVNPNFASGTNVAIQLEDPSSLLAFYKQLLAVRKETPALIAGDFQPLEQEGEAVLAFTRNSSEQSCLVLFNFSDEMQEFGFDIGVASAELVFSSHGQKGLVVLNNLSLNPFEVLIAKIN